jgi:catechol 2,3-dioxygenase-like lactoylglutathione lyase family enzyme
VEQRVSLVTLGVADLARARAFYEALGWSSDSKPADGRLLPGRRHDRRPLGPEPAGDRQRRRGRRRLGRRDARLQRPVAAEVDGVLATAPAAGATIPGPEQTFWGGYSGIRSTWTPSVEVVTTHLTIERWVCLPRLR